jgi:putative peptidoglycan lipid II flippase
MLFRSFFTVSFFISISRVLGFIRDIIIANFLGVSVLSDAFFAAFRLPNFFRRIFAEGAFNSAFVPIFIEKLSDKKTEKDEKEFLANIFSLLLYSLFLFVLILQIFMPFCMKILFPGFFTSPEKSDLLINFSRITVFYLIFISLVSLFSGVLNSLNKFAAPAASPIILNGTLIASIYAFGAFVPNYGYALSLGVAVAGVLQLIFIGYFVKKSGFLVYPKLPKLSPDCKKFFKKLLPGVVGANVMQINLLVDSVFASLVAGAVSYLYYADRVNQLPLAMIGIAIGIALLPNLTRKIKEGEHESANRLQNSAIEAGLILVLPATLALTILAKPIIATLFERGAFSTNETENVGSALLFYSLGLPSYVLVKIFEPAFFARGDTKTPMKIAICCLISNLVLNYLFYLLKFGFVGIVLASVFSSYLNLTLLLTSLQKRGNFAFQPDFKNKFLRILTAAILMAVSLLLLKHYFWKTEISRILSLSIMIFGGLSVYTLASLSFGNLKIVAQLVKTSKRKNLNDK